MTITTRKIEPLSTRAAFMPGSVNLERRTVDLVWTTGARVLRQSWWDGPWLEELSLDPAHVRLGRLNNGAPFLADHDGGDVARVLGVVEAARLEGDKGIATVRFAKAEDDPEADKVFRKIVDGIIQNVSVGYRTHKLEKIEGGDETTPVFRATDWEPYEISAVSMGADDGAGFRSAAPPRVFHEVQIHNPRSTERKPPNMDPEQIKQQEAAALAARQAEAAKVAELAKAQEEARRLERERINGIKSACRAASLEESVADRLVNEGVTLDAARAFVLDELAKRDATVAPTANGQHITGGEDASEKFARGAVSALLMRSVPELVRQAKAKNVPGFEKIDLDAGELRGFSVADFARECLERSGVRTRGLDRSALAAKAFTQRGGPYAGTGDFPVLLENVMNKTLMGAYAVTPDTWSRFCKVELVPDFRTVNRFRTGSLSVLDELTENGEFKNKSIPDGAKSTLSIGTKGNMIAVSRQLIINDDMGALTDLLQKLGRASRLSVEVDVYALITANSGLGATFGANPFFHSTNANVNATGSALSVAGIDADRVVLAQQKDAQSNEYLDLRPAILLVPVGLGGAARVINTSQFNHDSTKLQQPNHVQGLFRDIVDTPRLTGTRRYLFADPAVAPAIVVAFLEGQGSSPVLESQDGWRVDGTEMKVRFDYKAQLFDPKGAVTNAGA